MSKTLAFYFLKIMLAPGTTSTSLSSSRSITIQLRLVNSYILHLGLFQQTLLMEIKDVAEVSEKNSLRILKKI